MLCLFTITFIFGHYKSTSAGDNIVVQSPFKECPTTLITIEQIEANDKARNGQKRFVILHEMFSAYLTNLTNPVSESSGYNEIMKTLLILNIFTLHFAYIIEEAFEFIKINRFAVNTKPEQSDEFCQNCDTKNNFMHNLKMEWELLFEQFRTNGGNRELCLIQGLAHRIVRNREMNSEKHWVKFRESVIPRLYIVDKKKQENDDQSLLLLTNDKHIEIKKSCEHQHYANAAIEKIFETDVVNRFHRICLTLLLEKSEAFQYFVCFQKENVEKLKGRLYYLIGKSEMDILEQNFPAILQIEQMHWHMRLDFHQQQFNTLSGSASARQNESRVSIAMMLNLSKKCEVKLQQSTTAFDNHLLNKLYTIKQAVIYSGEQADLLHSPKGLCMFYTVLDFVSKKKKEKFNKNEATIFQLKFIENWWPYECEFELSQETVFEKQRSLFNGGHREILGQYLQLWAEELKLIRGASARMWKLLLMYPKEIELYWTRGDHCYTDEKVFCDRTLLESHYIDALLRSDTSFKAKQLAADLTVWIIWLENDILRMYDNDDQPSSSSSVGIGNRMPRFLLGWRQNRWYYEMVYEHLFDIEEANFEQKVAKKRVEIRSLLQRSKAFVEEKSKIKNDKLKVEAQAKKTKRLMEKQNGSDVPPPSNTLDRGWYEIRQNSQRINAEESDAKFDDWLQQRHFDHIQNLICTSQKFMRTFTENRNLICEPKSLINEMVGEQNAKKICNESFLKIIANGSEINIRRQLEEKEKQRHTSEESSKIKDQADDIEKLLKELNFDQKTTTKAQKTPIKANKKGTKKVKNNNNNNKKTILNAVDSNVENSLMTTNDGTVQQEKSESPKRASSNDKSKSAPKKNEQNLEENEKSAAEEAAHGEEAVAEAMEQPMSSIQQQRKKRQKNRKEREMNKIKTSTTKSPIINDEQNTNEQQQEKRDHWLMITGDHMNLKQFLSDTFLSDAYRQFYVSPKVQQRWILLIGTYINEIGHRIEAFDQFFPVENKEKMDFVNKFELSPSKTKYKQITQKWQQIIADQSIDRFSNVQSIRKELFDLLKLITKTLNGQSIGPPIDASESAISQVETQLMCKSMCPTILMAQDQKANSNNEKQMCILNAIFDGKCDQVKVQWNIKHWQMMREQNFLDKKLFEEIKQLIITNDFFEPWIASNLQEIQFIKENDSEDFQSLTNFLMENEYGHLKDEQKASINKAIDHLKAIIAKWNAKAVLLLTGSYLLGALTPKSDIDATCVMPNSLTKKQFFGADANCTIIDNQKNCFNDSLFCKLCVDPIVHELERFQDAWVPMIKFKLEIAPNNFIDFDMAYAIFPANEQIFVSENQNKLQNIEELVENLSQRIEIIINTQQPRSNSALNEGQKHELDEMNMKFRSISGYAVNMRIMRLLANDTARDYNEMTEIASQCENHKKFRTVLMAVKMWATEHHLYNNKLGFFSGIGLSILVAKVMLLYPMSSIVYLIEKFFFTFSTWPWPMPVKLAEMSKENSALRWNAMDEVRQRTQIYLFRYGLSSALVMPVITPGSMEQNTTFNINKSTGQIIRQEMLETFLRLRNLKKNNSLMGNGWQNILMSSQKFEEKYNNLVRIICMGMSTKDFDDFCGYVETRLRIQILANLEHFGNVHLCHARKAVEKEQCQQTKRKSQKQKPKNEESSTAICRVWMVGLVLKEQQTDDEKHEWVSNFNAMLCNQFSVAIIEAYRTKNGLKGVNLNVKLETEFLAQ